MEDHPPDDFFEEQVVKKKTINDKEKKSVTSKDPSNKKQEPAAVKRQMAATALPKKVDDGEATKQIAKPEEKKQIADASDVMQMLAKMQGYHDDLKKKLEVIYEQRGLGGKKIKEYIEDPSNFTAEQWENIQRQRQIKKDKFLSMLGVKTKAAVLKKEQSQAAKERKSKTVAKRKKWLQM